ncbi:hypothetical protein [Thermosulfuriphilus ammonigenes]|nr:hypothetical protein [Thermosulfuriphilus ammonigenes]
MLTTEPEPCPFGIEDAVRCPYGAHVLDLNRVSGWRYECRRLGGLCPAYKQSISREELARKVFGKR